MVKDMAKAQQKKRYMALTNLHVGDLGNVQYGEIVDTEQVEESRLNELVKAKQMKYVDTVAWNKNGDDGRGSWDAVAEPEAEQPKVTADSAESAEDKAKAKK